MRVRVVDGRGKTVAGVPVGIVQRVPVREKREDDSKQHGTRRAVAGVQKQKRAKSDANARHRARRKGWRKK